MGQRVEINSIYNIISNAIINTRCLFIILCLKLEDVSFVYINILCVSIIIFSAGHNIK